MVFLQLIAALAAAKNFIRGGLPWTVAPPAAPSLQQTWDVGNYETCPSFFPPFRLLLDAPPTSNTSTISTVYFILNCPLCETRRTLSKFCSLRPPIFLTRKDAKALLATTVIDSPSLRSRLCVARAKHTNKTLEISWGSRGHHIFDNLHNPTTLFTPNPLPSLDLLESDDDDNLLWPLNDDT
jgi:hypothetical protein